MAEAETTPELEPETNPIHELIQGAISKDYNAANNSFNDLMTVKISDVLDQEKIKLASSIYNDDPDPEDDEEEVEYDDIPDDEEGEDEDEAEDQEIEDLADEEVEEEEEEESSMDIPPDEQHPV